MKIQTIFKIFFVLHAFLVVSVVSAETEEVLAHEGFAFYEAKQYEDAIKILSQLVALKPEQAVYHHTLAKSYGRQAEQANWFKAIKYAKKTKEHLELAVKLEPNNVQFLNDLMDYFLEAPPFLGGDEKKAEQIRLRIENLLSQDIDHPSETNDSNKLVNDLNLHRK